MSPSLKLVPALFALLLLPVAIVGPACNLGGSSGEQDGSEPSSDGATDGSGGATDSGDDGGTDGRRVDGGSEPSGGDDSTDAGEPTAGDPAPVVTELVLSRDATCAVAADGAGYCWGANAGKKLGAGPGGPTQAMEPNPIADAHTWSALGLGVEHGCGLDGAGAAWCWGTGWAGELGNGQSTVTPAPSAVAGGHALVDLDVFDHYACGLDEDGQAWCWGDNKDGQFGDGTTEGSLEPVAGGATLTIADLDLGRRFGCGVTVAGDLHCWGHDYGDGTQLGAGRTWHAVAAGENAVCAIDSDGTGYCLGEVGDHSSDLDTPIAGAHTWAQLSVRDNHVCGLDTDGVAWCWGDNFKGGLGDGNHGRDMGQAEPVAVLGGHAFVDIAAGGRHTCGVTDSGEMYCWGYNEFGELGNGRLDVGATVEPTVVLGGVVW